MLPLYLNGGSRGVCPFSSFNLVFCCLQLLHSLVFTQQGTRVREVSNAKGAGTGASEGVCKNRESTAAKTLGRLTERQQQEALPQVESHEGASSCCPFLQEGLATVVLLAALVCRLGDYLQASFFLRECCSLSEYAGQHTLDRPRGSPSYL